MFSPYRTKDIKHKFVINPETEPKGPTRCVDDTERSRIHSAALRQHEDRMEAKALNEDWWGEDE